MYNQSIYPMYLSSLPSYIYSSQKARSNFTVCSSATSKDHLHPSLPSHKTLIYSFNLLTISLPLPLLVNLNCNLSIITYPIVTSHFHISIILNNFTSESYLSCCYSTQTATYLLPLTPLSPLTFSTDSQQFDFAKLKFKSSHCL